MSPSRRLALLATILLAVALLYPGVTRPVLTLEGTIARADLVDLGIDMLAGSDRDSRQRQFLVGMTRVMGFDRVEGDEQVYHRTRSILGAVEELARTGNATVAFLIVLFSMVIPLAKLLLQGALLLPLRAGARGALERVTGAVGKWSMADVFVMALIVAWLAGSASGQMGDVLVMDARLEEGFWFFLGYCLFSVASTALVRTRATAPAGAAVPVAA